MNWPPEISQYLEHSREFKEWGLSIQSREGVNIAVVIPVLAEKDEIIKTLLSLSQNSPAMLCRTIVICVVNNRRFGLACSEDIENNAVTLAELKMLETGIFSGDRDLQEILLEVRDSSMDVICIDASSQGNELPDGEGVGTARKIGMDVALSLFDYSQSEEKVLVCLDADTRVEANYIEAIYEHYSKGNGAAVIDYSHSMPEDMTSAMAAAAYELYLRYYEAGLAMAASPYAYHTIGSTMTCTAKNYVATGGMNRRMAGEDFYFLQKLAKHCPVSRISETTVYPAGRVSNRVPFGTGKKLGDMESEGVTDFLLYHPQSFVIIKEFIELVEKFARGGNSEGSLLLKEAGNIHSDLLEFLTANKFTQLWDKLRKNSSTSMHLIKHFHNWFDDFRTLKLVHHLRDNSFPNVPMFDAAEHMLKLVGFESGDLSERGAGDLGARLDLVGCFRKINNGSGFTAKESEV